MLASLASLHDIGNVGVPDRLLRKAEALSDEELAEMRKQPAYGREVLELAESRAGRIRFFLTGRAVSTKSADNVQLP